MRRPAGEVTTRSNAISIEYGAYLIMMDTRRRSCVSELKTRDRDRSAKCESCGCELR